MNLARTESIGESRHEQTLAHYERQQKRCAGLPGREKELATAELSRLRADFASAPTVELMLKMIRAFDYDEATVILALHNPEDDSLAAEAIRFVLKPMFENSLERIAAANAKHLALVELEALEALGGIPS